MMERYLFRKMHVVRNGKWWREEVWRWIDKHNVKFAVGEFVGGDLWLLCLLKEGFVEDDEKNECFVACAFCGYEECVIELLKDEKVDPCCKDYLPIQVASENGHVKVVDILLKDRRADPGAEDDYAIRFASEIGHAAVVDLLLKDGRADPSANNDEAIRWASENGHVEVVNLLLKDGRADPRANDSVAIRWASEKGRVEVVD